MNINEYNKTRRHITIMLTILMIVTLCGCSVETKKPDIPIKNKTADDIIEELKNYVDNKLANSLANSGE